MQILNEVLESVAGKNRLLYQVMDNNLIVIKEDPNAPIPLPDVVIRGKVTGEGGVAVGRSFRSGKRNYNRNYYQ